jgi:hypothetical protein
MNQGIKLDLNPQMVDILLQSASKQPFELVSATIQEVMRQANDQGLQDPAPGPVAYVEGEIRTAWENISEHMAPNTVINPQAVVDALVRSLAVGRQTPPPAHHPV